MIAYIVRRLMILPIILFGVTVLIFGMMSFLEPAQRASLYVQAIPKGAGELDRIIEKYGLDDPMYVQYFRWLKGVLRGDLGFSRTGRQPVLATIKRYIPASFELAIWAAVPLLWVGIQLGVISALHHNKFIDQIMRVFAIVGWSFPTFVFGLLVLMIFYAKLQWFPAGRLSEWASQVVLSDEFTRFTGMNTVDALLNLRLDIFWDALRHLILPVITLSYVSWALVLRVTRSSMLEVLRADYVTTARSKGVKERLVIDKHAKPNALIPVATVGGIVMIGLMSGVVITETVFNYRGLGWWVATSAGQLDVISVLGFSLFYGVLVVCGNLVVDVMYAYLDPRVRLQ
ncbi:MAG: ABC transporter permease subunit [Anaerolineae bacterium]|nr:ABC transporter permease subunit [Anaerolineae bacterium]NIN99446.1 ABC transporter permease subunit [Anaerolineae bacterium]NIQ82311.1 ABC transporter permease subunit [Anaerolineae bacterium]